LFVIGLTGGIASGKSTVSRLLAEHGAAVIDADRLGHETYVRGTDTYDRIVRVFGDGVVDATGEIDRRALGSRVFGQPDAMRQLTDIVWSAIHDLAARRLHELQSRGVEVAVLEAAVLVEANWFDLVDETWVVVVTPDIARQRLIERNGLSAEAAEARLVSQITNEERLRHADVVIDNNASLDSLRSQVSERWTTLKMRLSKSQQLRT
jgi:dephospho-CoA kinase